MDIHPTKEVDYRTAEKVLKLWLKTQGMGIMNCQEWARWNYNDRPFWSVWGLVHGSVNKIFTDFCGIQIYDDGEVQIITKNIWSESDIAVKESKL